MFYSIYFALVDENHSLNKALFLSNLHVSNGLFRPTIIDIFISYQSACWTNLCNNEVIYLLNLNNSRYHHSQRVV